MKFARTLALGAAVALLTLSTIPAQAKEPWEADTAQEAANKKLVLDFWREVYEAHHMDLAPKYLAPEYVQHNPNIPSGRDAIVKLLGKTGPIPIKPELMMPPVMAIAKGDLVILVFERERLDATDKTRMEKWFGFDMLRVRNGKITEHWDAIPPRAPGTPYQSPPPPWERYESQKQMEAEQQQAIQQKEKAAQPQP